jgi:predicted dehydrogenase
MVPGASSLTHPPLRVAIAGLGFGETVHLPALRAAGGTEPVALWHPRAERLEQACAAAGLPGHTDFSVLLNQPEVEAVVIATPPEPRFELARQALLAGKHLMLEKPVALRAAEVEELQRLALARQLTVAVDFEYRAVPLFQQLAGLLQSGALGELVLVKLDWLMGSRADASRPWNWYSQAAAGGGVLGALGTHAFDILHWLVGPSHRVAGRLSTAIRQRPLPDGSGRMAAVDAEDGAMVQLDLESGSGGRVPAQVCLSSVTRRGRGCWLEIYGREGTAVLGSDNQSDYVHGFHLWWSQAGEPLRRLEPEADLAFPRTWEDGRIAPVARLHGWWSAAVREGRPMVPGLAEAVSSQRCCDQARAAH